ncbi:Protein CBG27237 [Caenorhabditis briggsae]|uniref:Protein CBG27237 n=2 Tax=Caenorhabditis briggsae TaxID=6238 RepID=B6IFV9_CAEBR|nr:Protein CBG27237 [Caenorhabditis briggsae]ULT91497.1 hypothetical protein L3Y34_009248 [Caenorhabditis briggsae]CAR98775.1 Protein CBG27237 [Caenorhabditis briggsae]
MNLLIAVLLFAALAVYVFARPVDDVRYKRDSPPGPPDHPPPSPDPKNLIVKRDSVPDPGPKAKRDSPPGPPDHPPPPPHADRIEKRDPGPPVPPLPLPGR